MTALGVEHIALPPSPSGKRRSTFPVAPSRCGSPGGARRFGCCSAPGTRPTASAWRTTGSGGPSEPSPRHCSTFPVSVHRAGGPCCRHFGILAGVQAASAGRYRRASRASPRRWPQRILRSLKASGEWTGFSNAPTAGPRAEADGLPPSARPAAAPGWCAIPSRSHPWRREQAAPGGRHVAVPLLPAPRRIDESPSRLGEGDTPLLKAPRAGASTSGCEPGLDQGRRRSTRPAPSRPVA